MTNITLWTMIMTTKQPRDLLKTTTKLFSPKNSPKKPIQVYESMVNVLKQLKNTKRVNEVLKNEFHERENHDKKRAFTPVFFNTTLQRTPKFPDPEKYGRAREEFESFKYAFRAKLRANYDWYPTENMKFDYAFFCLKNVARTQMLFKMNEKNVLIFYSAEELLRFLNVNFGDQNKKQLFLPNTWLNSSNI